MYERDQCRQKSEITLPSSKPNVQEILWKSLEIRNLDTKMGQDGVKLSGEVLISVLYQEEEETDRVQWYETVFHWTAVWNVTQERRQILF